MDQKIFHIPALFGDDFSYEEADFNFDFLRNLRTHLEELSLPLYGMKMELRFSTWSEYLQA